MKKITIFNSLIALVAQCSGKTLDITFFNGKNSGRVDYWDRWTVGFYNVLEAFMQNSLFAGKVRRSVVRFNKSCKDQSIMAATVVLYSKEVHLVPFPPDKSGYDPWFYLQVSTHLTIFILFLGVLTRRPLTIVTKPLQ